jgi:hypothetical protein
MVQKGRSSHRPARTGGVGSIVAQGCLQLLLTSGCSSERFRDGTGNAGDTMSSDSSAPSTAASDPQVASGTKEPASEVTSAVTTTTMNSTSAPASSESLLGLDGAPMVFTPTSSAFSVNAALTGGDTSKLSLSARLAGTDTYGDPLTPQIRASAVVEWAVENLEPNSAYEYRIVAFDGSDEPEGRVLFEGKARTARPPGESFRFAMVSDTHIGADLAYSNQGDELVYAAICAEIEREDPDFMINLGDLLDYHQFGFNVPPPTGEVSQAAYLNYRRSMGNLSGKVAHFGVVGNWDGENGEFTSEEIMRSRDARMLYTPNPTPETYPEGGSPSQDYYAFTWGDALFVVLNVMTYTLTPHLLIGEGEAVDDWTLGAPQLDWLRQTLTESSAQWKFTFIHHTVGGDAGNLANSAYGRGGGRAAYIGEQAEIHQLMLDTNSTIFFHGHDHVFVDMEVDGLHYSDPGSAGAPWKFETADTGYEVYWTESGWSRVNVTPDEVHVEFIAQGGALLHEYTVTK